MKVKNWKASRGFGGVVVRGEDTKGKPVSLNGCKEITARKGKVVAIGPDGKRHELVLDAPPAAPAA